jgi:hypothetical protein
MIPSLPNIDTLGIRLSKGEILDLNFKRRYNITVLSYVSCVPLFRFVHLAE